MSEEARIRKVLDDRASAIRNKDAKTAVSYYASEIVNFDLAPPLAYRGTEATHPGTLEGWFETWKGLIGIAFDQLTIRSDGNLAFAHGLLHITGPRTDGTETDVWARMTVCLERQSSEWKIVHEHQSFPTKMDGSGLSASDLQP